MHQEPREAETHVLARAPPLARGERTWPVEPSSSAAPTLSGVLVSDRGVVEHTLMVL